MEKEVQQLLDTVADLRAKANVNAAFGEPIKAEGRTLIPVAKVGCGFKVDLGAKSSATCTPSETVTQDAENEESFPADGCGCAMTKPFAVIEVTPQHTRIEPVIDEQRLAIFGTLLIGWNIFWLARALVKIFGPRD